MLRAIQLFEDYGGQLPWAGQSEVRMLDLIPSAIGHSNDEWLERLRAQ